MKKLLPVLVLLGACAPDIAEEAPPGAAVVVLFDPVAACPPPGAPPLVPKPNDLAIDPVTKKIVVPPCATDSPAEKELNEKYLGALEAFPFESTASVGVSGDLEPESVNPKNVLAFDVTAAPVPVAIAPTFANRRITVPPPAGNWLRGHRYAIALIGGPSGLRGAANEDVIGSTTWALASSRNPLVTCTDLTSPDCRPAVDVIPSNKIDPAERLADQTASALKLEHVRRGYAPILDALAAPPVSTDRQSIPIVWTFSIVDAGEMTFDPANNVIPFPSDLARTGPGGTVSLPNPKTGKPLAAADCQTTDTAILLVCGLNTLDGFSTLAPPISESSEKAGALDQGTIDPKSLDAKTVGLVPLKSEAPAAIRTAPRYTPCLNCMSSADASGKPQTAPQQLQWKLDAPLDEKTTYFGFVTSGVKDDKGKAVIATPAFALLRSSNPLLDDKGKSTVSLITDDQAKQFEPIRAAFAPAFDGLAKAGVPRESLALAFPFTTQSESTVLDKLHGVPALAKAGGLPDFPLVVQDATLLYQGAAAAAGIPIGAVGKFFAGGWLTPALVTGTGGTFNPDPKGIRPQLVQFALSVPLTPPPAGGYPVTIFGHDFTRSRNDFLAIANSLAQAGQVVIATDAIFHGERTTCTGSKTFTKQATDDAACKDPLTMKCDGGGLPAALQGLCVLRDSGSRAACAPGALDPLGDGACAGQGQGRCAADGKCQGATADLLRDAGGTPAISGLAIFNLANPFAMRDNMRQQVIDLSQLVAVLRSTDAKKIGNQIALANGNVPIPFDTTKLGYVGQGLGGILGTLFNSVSPDTTNVVLNVPGGSWTSLLSSTISFADLRVALLTGLAAQGLVPGTPAFDQFLGSLQWVMDPADPANMGYRLTHPVDLGGGKSAPNAKRKAFIQFIQGDETVPNISNLALVVGANRSFVPTPPSFGCVSPLFCYEFTEAGDGFDITVAPTSKRHGFLLSPPSATAAGLALTSKAQLQAATFLATGALP